MKTRSHIALAVIAALGLLGGAESAHAQTTSSLTDDEQVLIAQIQSDKRAIVLKNLGLTDAETSQFTPIYDEYQRDRKSQFEQASQLINKYASNYDSMTDAAAKDLTKDFFKLAKERTALLEKYAKKLGRVLPATKVMRWVQIENKLNMLLDVQAASVIPLAR